MKKLIIIEYDTFVEGSVIIISPDKTTILNKSKAIPWLIEHNCWDQVYQNVRIGGVNHKNLPMFDEIILSVDGETWLVNNYNE